MQLLPKAVDTLFEEFLQDLPVDLEATAREFKAFARGRKIKSVPELLRAVFLYCGLDQTLREVAGTLTLLGERITDQSVLERLQAGEPWVRALLRDLLPAAVREQLPGHYRFLVSDGSTVQGPGAQGIDYRLHRCVEVVTLHFTHLEITDRKTGESLKRFAWQAGDVAIVDRGYNQPQVIVELVNAGLELVLRLNAHNMPLFTGQGERLDLVAELQRQGEARSQCLAVQVGPTGGTARVAGWVHAYRLPEEQAGAARRRCRANCKKGKQPRADTLFLAGWVLIFTTLAPEVLDGKLIGQIYRLRWQVELAIKRWKSLLDAGKLRSRRDGALAMLWLHGKLLYALLLERRARRTFGERWGYLDGQRPATWWRFWKLIRVQCVPLISGVASWQAECREACFQVMIERPRRRRLHTLPTAVRKLQQLRHAACSAEAALPMVA